MDKLILFAHFLACFLLVVAILLQSGKSSALGVFGGGGGDALFATSSSTDFIKKFTMGLALVIAVTSLMLSVFSSRTGTSSVVEKFNFPAPQQQTQTAPAAPAAPATPAVPAAPKTK